MIGREEEGRRGGKRGKENEMERDGKGAEVGGRKKGKMQGGQEKRD